MINHGRVAAVTAQGFTEMQGGLPIVVDGEVIGAVGASFDTPEHDVRIAEAGLAAVPQRRRPYSTSGSIGPLIILV